MAWTEGEKVGGYILGRQLGQGGMATVYLGHHPELDREVAIKVMHQNFLDDEGFVTRFRREAQIVAKLTHPHIVPVYDFNEHEGQPYLVMKYIQGWTLKKQLIKDPLDLEGIVRVMTAIGDALNYAHSQGILHRDIKPSNIVIDKEGVPYLTDFGLARLASSGESTMSADMLLGTPHYISPEQARGLKNLDSRTDIYALGVVLYELMVGKVPFTGDSAFSIIHDHIYTPLPPPTMVNPDLPEAVEAVLFRALEKKAEDRFETANDLMSALADAIKQGNLTELDPNRAALAEDSLAKIRAQYDDQATITPHLGVAAAIPVGSSNLRKAKVISKPIPFYDRGRFWFLSGCASLLIITFASFTIILGMAGNLQELAALSAGNDFAESHPLFQGVFNTIASYTEYDVRVDYIQDVPVLNVPLIALDDLPEEADDPILALIRTRSLYEAGNQDDARREVILNTPENEHPELQALYYLSAARIAEESDDDPAAVVYLIVASEMALENDVLFEEIRPVSVKSIYEISGTLRVSEVTATIRVIVDGELVGEDVVEQLSSSFFTSFATARNLISNENTALARTSLARINEPNPIEAEFNLLRAELQIMSGNAGNAERLLDAILEDTDAPGWVRDRAEDLKNEIE